MATTRAKLKDMSTRHAIFINRFAGSQVRQLLPFMEQVRRMALSQIAGEDTTKLSKTRYQKLLKETNGMIKDIQQLMLTKLKDNMKDFAEYEADFSARMFTKATSADFTAASRRTAVAAAFGSKVEMIGDDVDLNKALTEFGTKKRRELLNVIRTGVVAGQTSNEIAQSINQVARTTQQNHLQALVRTVTNHVSTAARLATVEDNADVVDGVEWVSTLDGRTTHTCQSLDGKIFGETTGPRPPIHWGCRSTVIPHVKDAFSIRDQISAERPAVGDAGAETVDGRSTYNSWLNKQSKDFQNDVLGESRAQLYREGGLNVDSFVDKNYKPLTLEQLKRKEPLAFEKAGLIESE